MELNLAVMLVWITYTICPLHCQTVFPVMETNLLRFSWKKLQKPTVIKLLLMALVLAASYGVVAQYNRATSTRIVSRKILSENKPSDIHPIRASKPLLVLIWNHPWNVALDTPPEGARIGSCAITYNRAMLEKAEAVVFPYMYAPKNWNHFR